MVRRASPPSGATLANREARWLAIAAQGLARPRPTGPATVRHLRTVVDSVATIQLDAINVLERTQYLVPFSRIGGYDRARLDAMSGPGRELFEYWGHAASLVPMVHQPLLRWRMQELAASDSASTRQRYWRAWELEHADYLAAILEEVADRGPLAASQLADPRRKDGEWWDRRSVGRQAMELLFAQGQLAAWRTGNFERVYDLPERVVPADVLAAPTPSIDEAHRRLLLLSAAAHGIATVTDLADYFRIKNRVAKARIAELVADGLLVEVAVDGWKDPAYVVPGARPRRPTRDPRDPAVALRLAGLGAGAHLAAVRVRLPHRGLRPCAQADLRVLRASPAARGRDRRPVRSQGRPPCLGAARAGGPRRGRRRPGCGGRGGGGRARAAGVLARAGRRDRRRAGRPGADPGRGAGVDRRRELIDHEAVCATMAGVVDPGAPIGAAPWWRDAVIYQIYVRSFADGNDDGMGDLPGIGSRLASVADLGVDAVWLTPFYPSPQADGGYDVADYRDVDPRFGTLDDLDEVVGTAHDLGLRVLIDLVPNHTSDQHAWFRAALAAAPGSAERARYLFRDGRGPGGDQPPNDWLSVFGGGAWQRVVEADGSPGQWYLHLFAPEQPDLDWTNPEVEAEFESILRFWFDRGVDGFRIDVAHGLAKDPALADIDGRFDASGPAHLGHPHWDQDEVHDVYRRWRAVSEEYDGDRTFVAEAWVHDPARLARYLRPDELHTAFDFNFLLAPWDAEAMRATIDVTIEHLGAVGAPTTWVLSNHDVVRHVTRYGGGEVGERRARAAALLMLALPGGAYIYQGEELGLEEVTDLPDEVLADPTFLRTGGKVRGRDGCRVPIPWSGASPPFGFSATADPWLPQPASWATRTVEREVADAGSMRSLYRDALALRRSLPALGDGPLEWVDGAADGVLVFRRPPDVVCVVNTAAAPVDLDELVIGPYEVLLASGASVAAGRLPADTGVWLRHR